MDDVVCFRRGGLATTMCGATCGSVETTTFAGSVTCPKCLEHLGVKKVVDEEKVEFAEFVVNTCVMSDDGTYIRAESYLKNARGDHEKD